jgi:hypothetical protein
MCSAPRSSTSFLCRTSLTCALDQLSLHPLLYHLHVIFVWSSTPSTSFACLVRWAFVTCAVDSPLARCCSGAPPSSDNLCLPTTSTSLIFLLRRASDACVLSPPLAHVRRFSSPSLKNVCSPSPLSRLLCRNVLDGGPLHHVPSAPYLSLIGL